MTSRFQSRLLWLALVVCMPLPFFLVETGHEPVAALAEMLAVTLALIAIEGTGGAAVLTAVILAVQVILGLLLLRVVSIAIIRLFERMAGERSANATLLLVVVLLGLAFTQPIYRTPFRTAGLHATFAEVFE